MISGDCWKGNRACIPKFLSNSEFPVPKAGPGAPCGCLKSGYFVSKNFEDWFNTIALPYFDWAGPKYRLEITWWVPSSQYYSYVPATRRCFHQISETILGENCWMNGKEQREGQQLLKIYFLVFSESFSREFHQDMKKISSQVSENAGYTLWTPSKYWINRHLLLQYKGWEHLKSFWTISNNFDRAGRVRPSEKGRA
mgnify:CR=1 FL=1